jgi:hypothetical protein
MISAKEQALIDIKKAGMKILSIKDISSTGKAVSSQKLTFLYVDKDFHGGLNPGETHIRSAHSQK